MENSVRTKTGGGQLRGLLFCAVYQAHGGTRHGRREHHPFPLLASFGGIYGVRRTPQSCGRIRFVASTPRTSPRRRQCCDLRVVQQVADSNSGGAYHETWYYTCATPKDQKLSLPYDSPMSLLAADPKVVMLVLRVICGDNDTNPGT